MFIWSVVEWCLVIFGGLFVITQLIVPALMNKPTFPLFRKVVKAKDDVEEELREEKVCLETERLRKEVEKLRKQKDELMYNEKEEK